MRRSTPRSALRLAVTLACLTAASSALAPATARAEAGELMVTADLSGWLLQSHATGLDVTDTRGGVALGAGARYALDDFWELGAFVHGGVLAPAPANAGVDAPAAEGAWLVAAEVRYVIDAFQWVPALSAGVGWFARTHASETAGLTHDLDVFGGLAVAYRPARDWAVELRARYHVLVTDLGRTPMGPLEIGAAFTWVFD